MFGWMKRLDAWLAKCSPHQSYYTEIEVMDKLERINFHLEQMERTERREDSIDKGVLRTLLTNRRKSR